ncbi:uncharacterized protein LOC143462764 [Clavelina lepadiformis]|uniref:uncharacterized protein LOC143462764 n=1 Tax=Clavelina lepadiformis TaxID=159417 RepID=UPI00404310BF
MASYNSPFPNISSQTHLDGPFKDAHHLQSNKDKTDLENISEEERKNQELVQDIFHVTKLGLLIPIQDLVDREGIGILNQCDKDGHTPVHWAALGGHTHAMRYFAQIKAPLDTPAKNQLGAQAIHWACVNGHVPTVEILLQAGVSIDSVDNKECTPLIIAAQYGRTLLAGFLMGKGARLQITDKEGDNALHWAAFKGHSELARLLIYSGFNPRQKDNFGQTPLHLASLHGDLLTVKLLCEQEGSDINLEDHNGNTPMKLAKGRKHNDVISYFESFKSNKRSYLPALSFKSIFFGPPGKSKKAFLFMLFVTCGYGYPAYFFKVLPYTMNFHMAHFIFLINTVVMWYCLVKAHNMDPGFLPKNVDEYDQALKQVAYFAEWKQGQNPLSRLCHTCRLVKPLRSKHCRITNRCVKQFDHYCPYIYNVVGYRNRHYFLIFLLGMLYTLLTGDYFVWYMHKQFGFDGILIFGGVLMGIFTLITLGLVSFTTFQAVANLTTNERINFQRYEYLKDGNGQYNNPFDQGCWNNVKEFFHLKEPLTINADDNERTGLHSVNVI